MLPVLLHRLGLQRALQGVMQKIYNILYKKGSSTNKRRYFVLLAGSRAKLRVLTKLQLMLLSILMLWLISSENKFSGEDFKSMRNMLSERPRLNLSGLLQAGKDFLKLAMTFTSCCLISIYVWSLNCCSLLGLSSIFWKMPLLVSFCLPYNTGCVSDFVVLCFILCKWGRPWFVGNVLSTST